MSIDQKPKCDVCKKKIGKNDYYALCVRCQPAWQAGRKQMKDYLLKAVLHIFGEN